MSSTPRTVEAYLDAFPDDVREILQQVRRTILDHVPDAGETISYQMPTVTMDGRPLLYFAGWKHHIGVYPLPHCDPELERDLAPYRAATDTMRMPLDRPIPHDLLGRVITVMVERRLAG